MPAHRHIVGQYRAWQEGGHLYIQMQLCESGSLAHLIQQEVCRSAECWMLLLLVQDHRAETLQMCCAGVCWSQLLMMHQEAETVPLCVQGRLTEPQAWQVLWQVSQGLHMLHMHQILHLVRAWCRLAVLLLRGQEAHWSKAAGHQAGQPLPGRGELQDR